MNSMFTVPTRPALFVSLDGPIIVPPTGDNHRDELLGGALAHYAKPFMHWASTRFDLRLVTDRDVALGRYVADVLGLPRDKLRTGGFEVSKTEVIAKHAPDFYWVDTELIPAEVSWLAQHGHVPKYVQAHPFEGVTLETKQKLEALLQARKR